MAEEKKPVVDPEDEEDKDPIDPDDDAEDGDDPSKKDDDEEEDDDDKDEDTDEPKIPLRNSASHIIARKNRKINKLKSDLADKDEDEEEGDGEESDDDSLTPEARTAVSREVRRAMGPLTNIIVSNADEGELRELFASEPSSKFYEKRIRAYMGHPAYKGVAASVIFHHLAFDKAATSVADRKRAADLQAKNQRGGGTSRRTADIKDKDLPSMEDMDEMNDEEIGNLGQKVKEGKFTPKEE